MNAFVNAEQDLQYSIHESAGTRLLVNHLIQDKETNEVFRILYLPKESGQNGFWIQTSSKSNIPKPFCEPDVLLALHTKRFEIIAVLRSAFVFAQGICCAERRSREQQNGKHGENAPFY